MTERYVWIHQGKTRVANGPILHRFDAGIGPERFARAAIELESVMEGRDSIAFGAFTFDPQQPGSYLVIPQTVTNGRLDVSLAPTTPCSIKESDPRVFLKSVELARLAILRGELDKVVLAMHADIEGDFDIDRILKTLATANPSSYVFCFENLVGASPELLVRRHGMTVESIPLAGSAPLGDQEGADLLASDKQRWEHELAVRTVVAALRPLCDELSADVEPSLMKLANIQHLATRVTGTLNDPLTALDLAGALHPTAAVCGLPREPAMSTIRRVEVAPRGRYAGPVGWVNSNGDGEFAIALRCAEIDRGTARIWAGAGIVAASDPAQELDEVRLKFRTMTEALC